MPSINTCYAACLLVVLTITEIYGNMTSIDFALGRQPAAKTASTIVYDERGSIFIISKPLLNGPSFINRLGYVNDTMGWFKHNHCLPYDALLNGPLPGGFTLQRDANNLYVSQGPFRQQLAPIHGQPLNEEGIFIDYVWCKNKLHALVVDTRR